MQYVQGIFTRSTRPGPERSDKGDRPRVFERNVSTRSPVLKCVCQIYNPKLEAKYYEDVPLPCQEFS
jgi:hypothetical protein